MLRAIRIGLSALLGVVLLLWAAVWIATDYPGSLVGRGVEHVALALGVSGAPAAAPLAGPAGAPIGGPFELVNQQGQTVTDATYRGRWMLIYFGYTFCPDVCPTELQTIAAALNRLGPKAARVAPLFITVDPKRDTPQVLARYVALFDPHIAGLTGTPAQISAVARAYRVYYADAPGNGADYDVDHSSFVYLMDPEGRFSALFNQGTSADEMAAAIKEHIAHAS